MTDNATETTVEREIGLLKLKCTLIVDLVTLTYDVLKRTNVYLVFTLKHVTLQSRTHYPFTVVELGYSTDISCTEICRQF